MAENEDKLVKAIDKLTKATHRSNNLGWMVLRGIFYSIGWIIGLALIATLIYYTLPLIGEGNALGRFVHAIANIIQRNQY